jgi:5-methylcytosine-specific restriction endonuclease McrA
MPSEEEFNAQWRASAHEAVPYTNDYPECFLVLPELLDGAIGQGCATKVTVEIKLNNDNTGYLKVTDNGIGIQNANRLLSWASKESRDIHHRYGHGSKKCLTKWNKDYNSVWYVKYRSQGGKLCKYKSPFKGWDTKYESESESESESETESESKHKPELFKSGLEWYIEFNKDILNKYDNVQKVFNAIKEIIRTRYSRKHLDKTDFVIKVFDEKTTLEDSSKVSKWTTFEEAVIKEIIQGNCKEIFNEDIDFNVNSKMTYRIYYITIYGGRGFDLKKEFPTYGQKNMNCSRIHISLNQRIIEIAPFWKFMENRDSNHNDYNGIFGFVNFENEIVIKNKDKHFYEDNLPTPCTTKVSFYENCKNFIKMKLLLFEKNSKIIQLIKKEIKGIDGTTNDPVIKQDNLSETQSDKNLEQKQDSKNLNKSKSKIIIEKEPEIIKKPNPIVKEPEIVKKAIPIEKESIIAKKPNSIVKEDNIAKEVNIIVTESYIIDKKQNIRSTKVPNAINDNKIESNSLSDSLSESSTKSAKIIISPKSEVVKTKGKQGIPSVLKKQVWSKYIGNHISTHKCLCCKINDILMNEHHCGHVIPESKGGENTIDNLRPICSGCNLSMGSTNMIDFVKKCGYYIG